MGVIVAQARHPAQASRSRSARRAGSAAGCGGVRGETRRDPRNEARKLVCPGDGARGASGRVRRRDTAGFGGRRGAIQETRPANSFGRGTGRAARRGGFGGGTRRGPGGDAARSKKRGPQTRLAGGRGAWRVGADSMARRGGVRGETRRDPRNEARKLVWPGTECAARRSGFDGATQRGSVTGRRMDAPSSCLVDHSLFIFPLLLCNYTMDVLRKR